MRGGRGIRKFPFPEKCGHAPGPAIRRGATPAASTLAQGPAGSGEVRERVPGISDRMLADRLHELAVAGLLTRNVHHGPPLRSRYALTPHGNAFLIPLAALAVWAGEHLPPHPDRPRHETLAGQP
ncbi:winged helix-turn-helix transcriptional regulator [Streptomyces mirabilis]|uniref:winged helix-turn-helix transcriptional regulator n=1 Tax=Streptomyces mirabilis TaxID=68239 RepID=UPI0036275B1C